MRSRSLPVVFKDAAEVVVSDDGKPGAILDFDRAGDLVAMRFSMRPAASAKPRAWTSA